MPAKYGTVSAQVVVRDDFGRFIADMKGAAPKVVDDVLDAGIMAARDAAPIGHKHDARTTPIVESFYKEVLARTRGRFGNFARHAGFQDEGAKPHDIPGGPNTHFFWENEGRWWVPGDNVIDHPGNPATKFMDAGWAALKAAIPHAMRRHYGS